MADEMNVDIDIDLDYDPETAEFARFAAEIEARDQNAVRQQANAQVPQANPQVPQANAQVPQANPQVPQAKPQVLQAKPQVPQTNLQESHEEGEVDEAGPALKISTEHNEIRGQGRGYTDRGRAYNERYRGYDERYRGYDERYRGYEERGRGDEERGRDYEERGRDYYERSRGYYERYRDYDERRRYYDERRHEYDQGGRGYDYRGYGYDQGGRGYDYRGYGYDQGGRGYDDRGYGYDQGGRGYDSGGRGYDDIGRGGHEYVERARGYDRGPGDERTVKHQFTADYYEGGSPKPGYEAARRPSYDNEASSMRMGRRIVKYGDDDDVIPTRDTGRLRARSASPVRKHEVEVCHCFDNKHQHCPTSRQRPPVTHTFESHDYRSARDDMRNNRFEPTTQPSAYGYKQTPPFDLVELLPNREPSKNYRGPSRPRPDLFLNKKQPAVNASEQTPKTEPVELFPNRVSAPSAKPPIELFPNKRPTQSYYAFGRLSGSNSFNIKGSSNTDDFSILGASKRK